LIEVTRNTALDTQVFRRINVTF